MNSPDLKVPEQQAGHASKKDSSAPLSLSVRTANQLLALKFSADDIFMADGLLAKKQGMALLGPGGVGKSRLTTQLAFSTILGRPFLGLPVNCADKRWLLIQAENSNRRLHHDLQKHRTQFTTGDWARINERLHFHTLEHELDDRLRLSESDNANGIAKIIRQHRPDIVVFDPLNAFAKSNLNTDDGMLGTLHALTGLCRLTNPDAAIVVVHHTLTGKEGFKKAVGPDRSSYGRGSKSLHSWARGQINIAPGDPDDSRKLMIACGKNSDGREFEPLGAILNTDTMLYEVDPHFDLDVWRQRMCGDPNGRSTLTPEHVAEYVAERPMTRADLVAEIIRDTGCQKTKAYEAIKMAESRTIMRTPSREYRAVKVEAK